MKEHYSKLMKIREQLNNIIIGKEKQIDLILTAMISDGHVLIEDIPGTGKTVLCKSLSRLIDSEFKRIQFSSDLLPTDISGLNVYSRTTDDFILKKGPIFTNLLLADEINRGSSKTQAALFEAMEEKQVTIDETSYTLDEFFFILATQNPFDIAGTYDLPENQLDRFLFSISLGYVEKDLEMEILKKREFKNIDKLEPILTSNEVLEIRKNIKNSVKISDSIYEYLIDVANETRDNKEILLGMSTRSLVKFTEALKAYAFIKNRDFVIPDDVKDLFIETAKHRIFLNDDDTYNSNKIRMLNDIIKNVKVV